MGDAIGEVAKQSEIFAGIVAGGVVFELKRSIDAYNESERILKQLDAVLQSTGGTAGMTKQAIIDLSKSLQKNTTISDESALATENMLLTFTDVGKNIFPGATKAIIDTAYAMNHGLTPTTEQLVDMTKQMGKALQDPEAGLGALHRVGVNVDELSKKFETVTDKTQRQKLIIEELNKEFGGSGAKAADTFSGKMEQLKDSINDVEEVLGKLVLDAIQPFVNKIADFVKNTDFVTYLDAIATYANLAWLSIKDFANFGDILRDAFPPWAVAIIQAMNTAFLVLSNWISQNQELVKTFFTGLAIGLGALLVIGTITALISALLSPFSLALVAIALLYTAWQTNFLGIQQITQQVIDIILILFNGVFMPLIQAATDWVKEHWQDIKLTTSAIFQIIYGIIQVLLSDILAIFIVIIALITGNWKTAWEQIQKTADITLKGVMNILDGGITLIKRWGGEVLHALTQPFEDAWNRIQDLVNKIQDKLDFTKRHSPSVVDIVKRGVYQVNKALEDIDMPINLSSTGMPAPVLSQVGGSSSVASINISLDGAIISDELGAMRMSEQIGDAVIKRLQANIRM